MVNKRFGICVLGSWAFAAALASAQAEPADVSATSRIDRTAMFVGDRVTYTVDITCRRGADILLEDVALDKLKTDGLDVVSSETERHEDNSVTGYTLRYLLTTYRLDATALTIAPIDVRYYVRRAGEQVQGSTPAGSVHVAGAEVALRSLLPESEGWHQVRDGRPPAERPMIFRMLGTIGVAFIIVSIAPVVLLGIGVARRARQRRLATGQQSRRHARQEVRAEFAAVRDVAVERPEARREAFARLDALVRRHLADTAGVPALSLTPAEIGTALAARPSRAPADAVASVLDTCEVARYAPPEQLPSPEAWRQTLESAEQLLGR